MTVQIDGTLQEVFLFAILVEVDDDPDAFIAFVVVGQPDVESVY